MKWSLVAAAPADLWKVWRQHGVRVRWLVALRELSWTGRSVQLVSPRRAGQFRVAASDVGEPTTGGRRVCVWAISPSPPTQSFACAKNPTVIDCDGCGGGTSSYLVQLGAFVQAAIKLAEGGGGRLSRDDEQVA